MHAWILFGLLGSFHDLLNVGRTYDITNFLVTPYEGTYKCVEGDVHIRIYHLTNIVEVPDIFEDVFHFVDFATIDEVHFQDDNCIDIYCTIFPIYFAFIICRQIYKYV